MLASLAILWLPISKRGELLSACCRTLQCKKGPSGGRDWPCSQMTTRKARAPVSNNIMPNSRDTDMKMLKSMLFIPGDSEKKMIKGNGSKKPLLIGSR